MLKHKVSANTLVARAQQWARASEQPFLSLGTEFLCAAAWPLCTVVFAFGHASANNDIVLWQKLLGVGLYVAICSMLRAAAPGGHVAISGAFVVADLMFGTAHDPPPEGSGRPRTPGSRDYSPMLWARLLMQASGSLCTQARAHTRH